jgi:hypothetical protein
VHGERVHSVYAPARNSEASAAARKSFFGGDLRDVGRHGIEVVLDEEHQRDIPGRGQVHGF